MRILYLTPTTVFSGGERVTRDVAQYAQSIGHTVLYCGLEGPVRAAVEGAGLPFLALPGFTPAAVKAAVRGFSPDLLHAMDFRASAYAALTGVPFVAHLHNNPLWLSGLGPNVWAMRFFSARAARILTVSESVMGEYRFGRRFLNRTTVLKNVVDTQKVLAEAAAPLPPGYAEDAAYDLLFFGRLTEQKDPLRFVRLAAALREKRAQLSALMIGEGELRGAVEAEIARLHLSDAVRLSGYLRNPFPLVARARLLLMPSRWEGFGLTAVESMALGLPALVSPVGGLKELAAPDCGGACESDADFLRAADALLSDESAYAAASAAARACAARHADRAAYDDAIAALYRAIEEEGR